MKKWNGFTLMELLAVFVVIAIIALIVFPIVGNVVSASKKKAFSNSVEGLKQAIFLDYQKDYYAGVREYRYENETLTLLSVNGAEKNKNIKVEGIIENGVGTLFVDKDGNTSLMVYNTEWCAVKEFTDNEVTVEEKTEDNCIIPVMITNFFVGKYKL